MTDKESSFKLFKKLINYNPLSYGEDLALVHLWVCTVYFKHHEHYIKYRNFGPSAQKLQDVITAHPRFKALINE